MLGKKMQISHRAKVYVNVYDFTPSNKYISFCGLGAYHTGLQINDMEFCFCVIDEDPKMSGVLIIDPQTAQYQFSQRIQIGQTQLTDPQFRQIVHQISQKYTCGQYNVFKCNCNHFTDQMARKLTGKGLPSWIFRSTNILRFLCCCLPTGMVNGQWALQALKQREQQFQIGQHERVLL